MVDRYFDCGDSCGSGWGLSIWISRQFRTARMDRMQSTASSSTGGYIQIWDRPVADDAAIRFAEQRRKCGAKQKARCVSGLGVSL